MKTPLGLLVLLMSFFRLSLGMSGRTGGAKALHHRILVVGLGQLIELLPRRRLIG